VPLALTGVMTIVVVFATCPTAGFAGIAGVEPGDSKAGSCSSCGVARFGMVCAGRGYTA